MTTRSTIAQTDVQRIIRALQREGVEIARVILEDGRLEVVTTADQNEELDDGGYDNIEYS